MLILAGIVSIFGIFLGIYSFLYLHHESGFQIFNRFWILRAYTCQITDYDYN